MRHCIALRRSHKVYFWSRMAAAEIWLGRINTRS